MGLNLDSHCGGQPMGCLANFFFEGGDLRGLAMSAQVFRTTERVMTFRGNISRCANLDMAVSLAERSSLQAPPRAIAATENPEEGWVLV